MVPVPIVVERPLINGHEYSHTSVELLIGGIPVVGCKSMNYSTKRDKGKVYGTAPQIIGLTRGKEDLTCDMEIYRLEWEVVRAQLGIGGNGFMDSALTIRVTIAEPGRPVIVDRILSAYVIESTHGSQDGNDPHAVKLGWQPMRIFENGLLPSLPLNLGI